MNENARAPTTAEILDVIADIEAGAWLDPTGCELAFHWCHLIDPSGVYVGDGMGFTPGEAMAYAWVHAHSPDALIENDVGNIPLDVVEGWQFELGQPGEPWHRPRDH